MTIVTLINTLQLNTGNIECTVDSYSISKKFNNAKYSKYKDFKPVVFPVSANSDEYSLTFTLWARGNNYEELLDKEKAIYDELNNQFNNSSTINFSSTAPLWFDDDLGVQLIVENTTFKRQASDGINYITIKISGVLHSLISDVFPFFNNIGIAGNAIGDFSIGSG